MGFSLQERDASGISREEVDGLSLNNGEMAWLRAVIAGAISRAPWEVPNEDEARARVRYALSFNEGELITPKDCRWLAGELAAVDRDRILADGAPGAESILTRIDELRDFSGPCAEQGGFEVW